jgi:predicted secreted protein
MSEIQLSTKDNNSVVQAHINDVIIITLNSNATTGYQWKIDSMDEKLIQNTNSGFVRNDSTAPGASGQQYFAFKPLQNGSSKISLKYLRNWQGDADATKRFDVAVDVS